MIAINQDNKLCLIEGCQNPREKRGYSRGGKPRFRSLCSHHSYLKQQGYEYDYINPKKSPKRYIQGICEIQGCDNKQVSKGLYKGRKRYDCYCSIHRQIIKEKGGYAASFYKMQRKKCELCAWIGPCDRHRIISAKGRGKYTKDNIIIVCPNCHRLIHRGLLKRNNLYDADLVKKLNKNGKLPFLGRPPKGSGQAKS
jgi:hypothetical protein